MGRLTNNYEGCNQIILCGNEICKEICEKNQCSSCPINKAIDKLAAYEDIIDEPEKLKIIDKWYSELCKENGQLMKELAEYKKLEEEGHLLKLQINTGDTVYEVSEDGIEECVVKVLFYC